MAECTYCLGQGKLASRECTTALGVISCHSYVDPCHVCGGTGKLQPSDTKVVQIGTKFDPDRPRDHVWGFSGLGHGAMMCQACKMTDREAYVLGGLCDG